MKYVFKRIIVGVSIGIILMFVGRIMPKAESYTKTSITATCRTGENCSSFNANYFYYTFPTKTALTHAELDVAINSIDLRNYNGFKITVIISEYNQDYFEVYNEYPTSFTWTGSVPESYTITYADGTQARVTGGAEITGWQSNSVSNVNYSMGSLNDTTFAYQLGYRSNGSTVNYNQCFIESANNNQITWNCPKTTNGGIQSVTELVFKMRYRTDNPMSLYVDRYNFNLYVSDTDRIIEEIDVVGSQIIDAINNGNSATQQAINQNTQATQQQTQAITSSDISGANSDADGLKNNTAFNDSSGISSLISLPLRFINNLGTSCSPINLTIPYMETQVQIPCMRTVISTKMPALATIITAVVNGFLLYNIFIQIIDMIHGAKNPDDDRLEVVEL